MRSRIVSATEFKAKCLALIDEVDHNGGTITITKRGPADSHARTCREASEKSSEGAWIGKVSIAPELLNSDAADLWDVLREA